MPIRKKSGNLSYTPRTYIEAMVQFFCEPFGLSASLTWLVQGHLKALNHLSFSSLHYTGQSGARPEPRATWRLIVLLPIFILPGIKSSLVHIFLDAYTNSRGHISHLHIAHGHASSLHVTHAIYVVLLQGNNLFPVYFRKQVYLLWHPCNLCSIFAGEQPASCLL